MPKEVSPALDLKYVRQPNYRKVDGGEYRD